MSAGAALATVLWQCFDERRFADVAALLADDFVAERPQTAERIRGPANFIALNEHYPGRWRCHLEDLIDAGDRVITAVRITDGTSTVYATSLFEIRAGKIARAREFFADEGEPPYERDEWTELYMP